MAKNKKVETVEEIVEAPVEEVKEEEKVEYPHPDTDLMSVFVIQERLVGRRKLTSFEASPYKLLRLLLHSLQ